MGLQTQYVPRMTITRQAVKHQDQGLVGLAVEIQVYKITVI
jgi:hypothetical protein